MTTAGEGHDAIFISGVCVLGQWVTAFVSEAYRLSERAAEVLRSGETPFSDDLGRSHGGPRAFLVEQPSRMIMDVLQSRAVPIVGVLDDPVDCVRYAMAVKSWDFFLSLRQQTAFASAHHLLLNNPAVLLVERSTVKPARGVLATLMAHIGLQVRSGEEAGLMERFAGTEDQHLSLEQALAAHVEHYVPLDQLRSLIAADDVAVVRQVLSPLMLGAVSRDIGPITWVTRTFLQGDRVDHAALPVMEITGGPRIILYGPYFHLPPGEWKVRITVAFSAEARHLPFRLILYARDKPIAAAMFKPEEAGAFQGIFTVRHVNPEDYLEIHLRNEQGAIDGHIALGELTFTREAWISAIDHREAR